MLDITIAFGMLFVATAGYFCTQWCYDRGYRDGRNDRIIEEAKSFHTSVEDTLDDRPELLLTNEEARDARERLKIEVKV